MLDYLKSKRGKAPVKDTHVDAPILTAEDEEFIKRITSEADDPASTALPPSPPPRPQTLPEAGNPEGNDAQLVLSSAREEGYPESISTPTEGTRDLGGPPNATESTRPGDLKQKARSTWSWVRKSRHDSSKQATTDNNEPTATEVEPSSAKVDGTQPASDAEIEKEESEVAAALEQLNLAAVDNRAFSLSKETRELLSNFTLVLKDLVNGVPTAYNDLESLLTNSDDQLQKAYDHLPSALQKLVKKLPKKMGESITPEVVAAAAEKGSMKSKLKETAAHGASKAGLKAKVPSLKDLVTKPGAVAGMLKAIVNFLKLRFPALFGLNVLYALGLFVLLLIFWYCHKRGREVRLEKERLDTEDTIHSMDKENDTSDTSSVDSAPHPQSQRFPDANLAQKA